MKTALLLLACATIAGCWRGDKHYTDVLAATRDPMFVEWLRRNDLAVSDVSPSCGCSVIFVQKLVEDEEVE